MTMFCLSDKRSERLNYIMKTALLLKTLRMIGLPLVGALGAWMLTSYPTIQQAFCSGGL